jgi:GWxTD domain-containing protein
MKGLTLIVIIAAGLLTAISCGSANMRDKVTGEPVYDDFLTKTELIMLKSEIKIYKHLPDRAAREEFVEEFWKKRDPTPGTEENENRMEYERRLEFVDRWFQESVGSGRGWDSDRGKVYLMLGPPDERMTQQGNIIDRFGRVKRVLKDIWAYHYLRVYLEFVDEEELGVYRLRIWPVELLAAIERAKFIIHQDEDARQYLSFKASFKDNQLTIRVPSKDVTFDEQASTMTARFHIKVYVYLNYKKSDEVEFTRQLADSQEAFLSKKYIQVTVPYTLSTRGKYLFDIVVKDMISGAASRDTITHKY